MKIISSPYLFLLRGLACSLLATGHALAAESEIAADVAQKKSSVLLQQDVKSDSPLRRRLAERELLLRARTQSIKTGSLSYATKTTAVPADALLTKDSDPDPKGKKDVDSPEIEELLKGSGFGLTAGYGYYFRSQQQGSTVKVTYNFYSLYTKQTSLGVVTGAESDSPWLGTKLTSLTGWVGTAMGKVENRAGTAKETPLVFGLSFGVGHVSDRSSAVFIDVGGALFHNRNFSRIEPYAGVSVDLEVFKALIGKFTDATSSLKP